MGMALVWLKLANEMTLQSIRAPWSLTSAIWMRSCAMVVTDANEFVAGIQDRMPVILEPKDFEQWERGSVKDAAALMRPANEDLLQMWPVSTASEQLTGGWRGRGAN
jgi:putative SOS response-associated peptidase YedK